MGVWPHHLHRLLWFTIHFPWYIWMIDMRVLRVSEGEVPTGHLYRKLLYSLGIRVASVHTLLKLPVHGIRLRIGIQTVFGKVNHFLPKSSFNLEIVEYSIYLFLEKFLILINWVDTDAYYINIWVLFLFQNLDTNISFQDYACAACLSISLTLYWISRGKLSSTTVVFLTPDS